MDFRIEKLKSGFMFNNPNQLSACGCGKSVQLAPATPSKVAPARQTDDIQTTKLWKSNRFAPMPQRSVIDTSSVLTILHEEDRSLVPPMARQVGRVSSVIKSNAPSHLRKVSSTACHSINWAYLKRYLKPSGPPASKFRRLSKPKPSLPPFSAAMSWASLRRDPEKPPLSHCRCSLSWKRAGPGPACRVHSSSSRRGSWRRKFRKPSNGSAAITADHRAADRRGVVR